MSILIGPHKDCYQTLAHRTGLISTWSNPRKKMDRAMTATSKPSAFKNPAHSRAMYDAPTTSVLPGLLLREKMSSEVRHSSRSPEV